MNHFDQAASTWDADPQKVERARAVAAAIRARLPRTRPLRALEYGAGTGLLGLELADAFAELTLADVSAGMLDVARQKVAARGLKHVRVQTLDWLRDPAPAARWEVIFSLMALHHIPDTAAILERWQAALSPGGLLFICDLDAEDGSFHRYAFDGHRGFDREALAALARQAGFQQIAFDTPYVIQREERAYPLFLLSAVKSRQDVS